MRNILTSFLEGGIIGEIFVRNLEPQTFPRKSNYNIVTKYLKAGIEESFPRQRIEAFPL
jgi:hypothetical protein